MKKFVIILSIIMFHYVCGCASEDIDYKPTIGRNCPISAESATSDGGNAAEECTGEMEADSKNRIVIAEALHVDENSRNIRFILSCLNTLGAGQIQSAESVEIEGEKAINLVAEDGTNYQMYLSGSGSVESVLNLDTNEWVIRSEQ